MTFSTRKEKYIIIHIHIQNKLSNLHFIYLEGIKIAAVDGKQKKTKTPFFRQLAQQKLTDSHNGKRQLLQQGSALSVCVYGLVNKVFIRTCLEGRYLP